MKFSHLLLFAAGVPLLASAQTERSMPAAAEANAPVTPLHYQSVFTDFFTVKEPSQSPDKSWVRANRALRGDQADAPAPAAQPAAEAAPKASTPEPMPGKHDHKGAHQ